MFFGIRWTWKTPLRANAVPMACFAATSPGSMASILTSGGPARRGSRGVRRRGWSRCRGRRGTATARTTGKSRPPAPVIPASRAGGRRGRPQAERSAGWLGWLSGGALEVVALGLEVGDQPVDQVVAVLRDGQVHALGVGQLQLADLHGSRVGEVHRHLSIGGLSVVRSGRSFGVEPSVAPQPAGGSELHHYRTGLATGAFRVLRSRACEISHKPCRRPVTRCVLRQQGTRGGRPQPRARSRSPTAVEPLRD